LLLGTVALRAAAGELPADDWPCVGGDSGGMRYSTLAQICRENVAELEVAWTYRTGELEENGAGRTIECTPIVVDGVMYVTTGKLHVVALDAATGKQLWRYDPFAQGVPQTLLASGGVNRGVAYWSDRQPGGERRILFGCASGHLISLDAATGTPDPAFGRGGVKDLREDLEGAADGLPYGPTSAPAVWRDRVIVGFSCGEGPGRAAPGDVRAFDVRTGAEVWRFHTVPRPGEDGHETWAGDAWQARGAANAWGGVTVDVDAGVAYLATGSAAFDFYGGDRHGANLFANCTLALDAHTGERRWHFQTLHHDLWDHDLPAYPNLVHVTRDGRRIPAVAQVTKTGHLFLFERASGAPLFEVRETPVPASDVPGEAAWPTQPIPVRPPAFAVQGLAPADVTDIGPTNRAFVLQRLEQLRSEPYAPPSLRGTVVAPGFHGGANWSGACFDPETETLYVNSNNVPNVLTLEPAEPGAALPYRHTGYIQFLDQEGYPASKPPWGLLNAIDLRRGDFAWRATLGEFTELTARGVPPTGTENFGGSIVTAGGLAFIGGTKDEKFRAFDKTSGRVLWETQLPAGGYATPCTYAVGGRQFVAIAAGGAGKLGTRAGDAIVCFALPDANAGAQAPRASR
jgi:quinoprotein glucose dehydrogenase